ncbi:WD40-repeat-containing domain protein [Obelidium mucronatum]|nr:WD40-repeat-containing domain protein [Obelidium mucronatum]
MDSQRRRDEIEKKKLKIAELKRTREERTRALQATQKDEAQNFAARRKELELLVASLVGEKARKDEAAAAPPPQLAAVAPTQRRDFGADADQSEAPPPARARLAMASMVLFEAPPQEKAVCYEKEQQTVDSSFQTDELPDEEEEAVVAVEKEADPMETADPVPEVPQIRGDSRMSIQSIMDEVEREIILQSWQFQEFFEDASKLVERALVNKYDVLTDYTMSDEGRKEIDTGKGIKPVVSFFDERWTKNRSVTDLSWSPRHPELVLASYNKNQVAINDPDGVLLIWNLHVPARPEFVFHAQSDITTATFSPFHPNLIIGGTYSGQILIWDNRSKSQAVMSIVGTQNAHTLMTCSTDGTVCSWQLDMLATPQEILELAHSPIDAGNLRVTNEIATTCFGFPDNETSTFWVGTEEGGVYQANRYDRAGGKAGINSLDTYIGHDGMITSLHFHPLHGPLDFSDLFLTSSVDWTVKLWKAKSPSKTATAAGGGSGGGSMNQQQHKIDPLYSFEESDDYVYDVKWSPIHPSLFGCVDGNGVFDVYDLNQEVEIPSASVSVGTGGKALNKLAWEKSGQKTAIGSSDGFVYIHDIGEMAQPQQEDFTNFQKTVAELGHAASAAHSRH